KENLETVTSTKTYTLNNDNALSTLTEQERLDKLVEDPTITKIVDFNGQDKSNFAASDLTTNNFSTTISPNTDAKVIIDTIQPDPNDPRGVIVTYKLESTKTNLGDTKVTSSKSLTTKITGFMTNKEKEQKTINSYNKSNFLGTPEPLILASSFVNNLDGVNIIFDPNDNMDHNNETIVVESIKSWDDKIGKLVVNFVVESNKNGEKLTSDLKEITINGYMTEKQRLNYLLADQAKSFEFNGPKAQNKTTVDEVKLSELSGYIRGTNENGELINANGINNVNLIIDAITGRDSQNGSITFTYHLVSTRTDIPNNDVVSDTQTYSLGLFQTNNEREKEVLNAKGPNDLDITVNKTKLASKYTNDEITLSSHDENISVIEKQIIGYNDITGEIKLSYKLRNEQSGVESNTKEIIIDGFKTESQRLNEILNSLLKNDINFDGNKKDQLPSMAPANNKANYSYDETKQTANKANIGINSITANNQTGENSLNLKLISTKTQNELVSNWEVTNFSAPESSNKDLIVDGFRTQAEQDKIDQDAEKQRLTSLVAHAEITYPNSKQILASSALKSGLNTVITSTDNNAEIIIKNITDKNDLTGQITVEYVIHSTKGGIYENVNTDVQTVTLNNFKTEQERLDALFADKVATASLNGIVSSEYKKYLPKDALEYLLLDIANLENAKVVIVSKEANDQTHTIDYTYRLVSTRGEVNGHNLNNVESSTTKNGSLNGFKTLAEAEKERLDAINVDNENDEYTHTIDYRDRATKLASKTTINDENWIWNITPDTDHTFSDQEIIAYDDITGKIKVKYKLQSTKTGFTDVKSDYKYATLTGFKTELQRLNELVKQQNQPAQITAKEEAKASGTNPKQPSQLTSDDFNTELTEAGKNENVAVETILDTQNANDETGEIALGYKLISTRPLNGTNGLVSGEWENPITTKPVIKSDTSEPLTTFNGYLTNDDVEIKRIENLIANLTLDYPDKEQYLPLYNETDVINSKVQVGLNNGKTLEAENIEIKANSMTITTRDDRKGEVVVSYTIVSKTRPDVEVEINATRSKNANTITGFKTEKQRLNTLNYNWDNAIANKDQINPADVKINNITPISDTNDQAQEVRIIGYNERTGEVNIKYNIYSKRTDLTDIYVTDKTATITGLQTESQRLDALIKNNDVDKSIIYVPNDQAVTKASSLVNNKEEVIKNLNNQYFNSAIANPSENKAKIVIQDIEADDETGNLTVKYVLQSTKDNLTDITSSQSQTLIINGFLTNLQE
ncbi:lipoprotein 17-related variable surface protein, partial [Mycoplasmopsis gallinarum]|uniref:lipoprotein 17-related variable surface protein n=1 Tax=Mycoplasmopsis gallinarum TaxID=29557 RepID=UPI000A949B9C